MLSLLPLLLALAGGGCGNGSNPTETCSDGVENQNETDVDCGGICSGCAEGGSCLLDSDCASGECENGECVAGLGPSCDDGLQNGYETDVDCGGPDCDPCADGAGCTANSDCASGDCDAGSCRPAGGPACDDGEQNGDETDVDCGGPDCDPCADGAGCNVNADCQSGDCDAGSCRPEGGPTCADGEQNGDESDVDCGGPDCDPCADGAGCNVNADCQSGDCRAGTCAPADQDLCPDDPDKTEPGICGCGVPDVDSDGDGAMDCEDGCPDDPDKTEPGGCGCGTPDSDSDGDGALDCQDGCPNDPDKTEPGSCGCGNPDSDSDGDGALDCEDGCPDDPNKTAPGACGCGLTDSDSDGDGVYDCNDNCADSANAGQADADGDGLGDLCDVCPLGEYDGICITRFSGACENGSADAFCADHGRVITFGELERITAAGWTRPDSSYHTLSVLQDPYCQHGPGSVGIPGYTDLEHYRCGDVLDYCNRAIMCVSGSYTFNGVARNLPAGDLTGWEQCWSGTYGSTEPLADILAACDGEQLLLGCRPVGSDTLTLAAMGRRDAVLHDCGSDNGCVFQSNGVGWYYSDSYSWGFAPGGEPVNRSSCDFDQGDQSLPEQRMCWHTGSGDIRSGYRCGANDLNGDDSWERVIYKPTPVPAFHGVLQNIEQAYLADHWGVCWSGTYGGNAPLAGILTSCTSQTLMLACRPVGDDHFTLAAMGPRDAVLHDCGDDSACVFESNGVGWYYSTTWSWGFAKGGQPVQRTSCDVNRDDDPQLRMCWHTGNGDIESGYRCGDNSLNGDDTWERLVLQPLLWRPGVQQNLPLADLVGWQQCWSGPYDGSASLADILAACSGDRLLLGCRPDGAAELTLAAMAPRADVLYDCGDARDCVHLANGVGWYYSDSYSWGFAPGGEPVNRFSCDYDDGSQTLPELRLCWHTGGGNVSSGYRCGAGNVGSGWERLIFQPGG
jgi:hypothetical protein